MSRILPTGESTRAFFVAYFLGAVVLLFTLGVLFDRIVLSSVGETGDATSPLPRTRRELQSIFAAIALLSFSCFLLIRREMARLLNQERLRGSFDGLTGLPNRALFRDRLSQALVHAGANGRLVAAGFFDLDRFKQVNDTLGHAAGDTLLRLVADRLVGALRLSDSVARLESKNSQLGAGRLGGDEFAFLLTGISKSEDVDLVARRILEALAAPVRVAGQELTISASIGAAIYPQDAQDADSLLRCADTAMYHAKKHARSGVKFYSETMRTSSLRKLAVEERMRISLAEGCFHILYQPIRSAETGCVVAAETLVRWEDSKLGVVSPDEFIPIAEGAGLIEELGGWIMRQACQQASDWLDSGFRPIRMAVNVSGRQLDKPDFAELVAQILRETGLSPDHLELEITEDTILRDRGVVRSMLEQLIDVGVDVSLDDFGTGYSSLTRLRDFPVSRVKIDESIVAGVPKDEECVPIVAAIIAMAKQMDLAVVAEGVENIEQATRLRQLGCTELQGFLFSEPVCAGEFRRFLVREKNE